MKILTLVVGLVIGCLHASAQGYSVDWFKVAGGGGSSTGPTFNVNGTVGQPEAGPKLMSGTFAVTAGYWSQSPPLPPLTESVFTITAVDTDRAETDDPQTETNLMVFRITRSGNINAAMAAVGWTTTGSGANPADGQDFEFGGVFPGGSVNFASGQTETNIAIRVRGDTAVETDEEFTVTLNMPAMDSGIGSPSTATGVIRNDDGGDSFFTIIAVDADRPESDDPQTHTNLMVFKITRGGNINASMAAVGWTTTGSGANPADGQDFEFGGVFPGGTVNFASGQTETNITIRVRGDTAVETDEEFTVALNMPAMNSGIGSPSTATGVIRNDDVNSSTPQITARDINRSWRGVASSADGVRLAAAVQGQHIHTSTDSGVTWTPRPVPSNSKNWYAVASSADGSKLVGVADGARIHTSTDAGLTWTERTAPGSRQWRSVASSADGTRLIAGVYKERLWTSSDSGVTWTGRENNRNWYAVASSADGMKLVAVVQSGDIYTSTDAGTNWTERLGDQNRQWYGVASSADGTKLVAAVNNGTLFTSVDSGVTWTPRESSRDWQGLASSADGAKLVATVQNGQLYRSEDSGVTWTPFETSRNWYSVASSADGAKLLASVFGGQLYTVSSAPAPTMDSVFTIAAVNADRAETDDPQTQTNLMVFKITRGGNINAAMAGVGWTTIGSGANPADGQDFEFGGVFPGGTVNFASGQTETNVAIRVRGDTAVESDEEFTVTLNMPAFDSVIGSPSTATGVIRNDDVANSVFTITTVDADRPETDDPQIQTNLMVFKITRGGNINASMAAVGWTTMGSGANPADGQDFEFGGVFPGGTVNFASGQTETNITIRVRGDTTIEADDEFTVTLSMPAFNSIIGSPATATGVIRNDDVSPPPAPTFGVSVSGGMITLFWPDTATGFTVESTMSLGPPIMWNPEPGSPQTGGGTISLIQTINTAEPAKFYRLKKP